MKGVQNPGIIKTGINLGVKCGIFQKVVWTYRVKFILSLHMMLDEHDIVDRFFYGEGCRGLGRLYVAGCFHDVGQS